VEQGTVLTAPRRTDAGHPVLVVIGGLPGSGKTTLLRRLLAADIPGVVGYDSEDVAERFRRAGIRIPYRLVRPWVHLWHRRRVLRGIASSARVVVLTDPWTRAGWRAVVLRAASRSGRRVRLVVVDASPAEAAAGQAARGRALSARAMRRHTSRSEGDRPDLSRALVIDRTYAARIPLAHVLDAARC
jgi:ABC-type cobalamin/Fe3+-siderophores transport system ATPase subunit